MARRVDPIRRVRAMPERLQLGEFTLTVEAYTNTGSGNLSKGGLRGVSGTAWTGFDCGPWVLAGVHVSLEEARFRSALQVVAKVEHPQTQIAYEMARQFKPGVVIGETLDIAMAMPVEDLAGLIRGQLSLGDWTRGRQKKGQILVRFENVKIAPVVGESNTGRIIDGEAVYPADPRQPKELILALDGFQAKIASLELRPLGATADVTLTLPNTMGNPDECGPATLYLGRTAITYHCELYAERPDEEFGPWIVGDTGMIVSGTGYTADFSSTRSPIPRPTTWKGLTLSSGTASGKELLSPDSNTGYLATDYTFVQAAITANGFEGELHLTDAFEFRPTNPLGYLVNVEGGWLEVVGSHLMSGQLGPGWTMTPTMAACHGAPGRPLRASFARVDVLANLDLVGEVTFDGGAEMAWGELTHAGAEIVAWQAEVVNGCFYLPGEPLETFDPETPGGFLNLMLSTGPTGNPATLRALGAAGITVTYARRLKIFSPDRTGGMTNPILVRNLYSWLRIGSQGVDGELKVVESASNEELGDRMRSGYVGNQPFKAKLFQGQNKREMLVQYIASAAYDSQINGAVTIPEPCKIDALAFANMELTSTANLVGGDVVLPTAGVTLEYWQLQLVPTGNPAQAGVMSVRTGRLVFLAAGISEPLHFARPFGLTWMEMLADGNLGELFLNQNSYGQRFDHIPYSPSKLALSTYKPGRTDGYLATCGTVHINFFGPHLVNIQDARYANTSSPYYSRYVTVPKTGEATCPVTDLHLVGTVDDSTGRDLATFDFPDAEMDYNVKAQDGFKGSGGSGLAFLHSDALTAEIEIHADAIDVCLRSDVTHDLELGLINRLGAMGSICGCIRIIGPLLQRISLYGMLEQSTSAGDTIIGPQAASVVETNITVTPSSFDLYASGDILLKLLASAVDISAQVHVFLDFQRGSAEGEIAGQIDCNSVVGGLEGEGQLTWYVDSSTSYLQGKIKVAICGWSGGVGLEGGLFLGLNVNRTKAWVLAAGGEKFGISDVVLPATLTGIYGYGQLSFGVNWYIFGGGVELFLGIGLFAGIHGGGVFGHCGLHIYGEILGGLVSAEAWANLALMVGTVLYFEGTVGLKGCVLWVICASVEVTAGLGSDGFYLN